MQSFRNLAVWKKSHELTLAVYQATKKWPREEIYGLISQIRRASVSIGANIAEGCGRDGDAEFGRFLRMSMGSATEVEYHLLLARDLGMLSNVEHERLTKMTSEIERMLWSLIKTVKESKRDQEKAKS